MEHYPLRPTSDRDWVPAVLVDSRGTVWAGHDTGLAQLVLDEDSPEVRWHTTDDGLAGERVIALHETEDGRIWIGAGDGLTVFDGNRFRSYGRPHGLTSDVLMGFAEDNAGNLWINSFSRGVMKMVLDGLITYDAADGLGKPDTQVVRDLSMQPARVHSVFENPAGELFVVSGSWFVNRYEGTGFESVQARVAPDSVLSWGSQGGFRDSSGRWWMLTHRGLYLFPSSATPEEPGEQKPLAIYTRDDGLPGDWPQILFEDSRGDVWVGAYGSEGLARRDHTTGEFRLYTGADGLPENNPVTAFAEDRSGALWVGFRDGGLARRTAGRFVRFAEAEGVPAGGIQDLHLDAGGRLWIASAQGGLVRLEDPLASRLELERYTTADGLSSNNVRSITDDPWGRLYVGTARGVDRLDPATGNVRHYTTAEGLANNFVTVAHRDSRDRLWFGTLEGLSRLVPRAEPFASPPPVWIGGLQVAGDAQTLSELGETAIEGPVLGPGANQIRIDFFGLSFLSGEDLRFQYKLAGADPDWSEPTEQRSVTFANIAPGRYRFLVRAVSAAGVNAIFVSQALRTQQTADSAAILLGITPDTISAVNELVGRIKSDHQGDVVLVVGHSNTVPAIIEGLGISSPPAIDDEEFDNLFIVHRHKYGPSKLTRLKYGKHLCECDE